MGKIVDFLIWIGILNGEESVFYIGGSDVLPPPLKGADEQTALEGLERGDEGQKQRLIEHNLRLVVYIARRFENTGVNLEDLISIGTYRHIGLDAVEVSVAQAQLAALGFQLQDLVLQFFSGGTVTAGDIAAEVQQQPDQGAIADTQTQHGNALAPQGFKIMVKCRKHKMTSN